jgi:hypothetical protein
MSLSNALVTPSIPQGIISPQLLMQEHKSAMLFTNSQAYLLPLSRFDHAVDNLINDKNVTTLATLDPIDNLYKLMPPKTSTTGVVSTIKRYATVNLKNIADTVNFWHCALGHPDVEIMIKFFESNSLASDNYPTLTPSNIRKFFPSSCPDCPIGNLQDKHPPVVPVLANEPGDTFELDFKGKWTDSNGHGAPYA